MGVMELEKARECFNHRYGKKLTEAQLQVLNEEFLCFLPINFDTYLIECYKQPYHVRMELITITYHSLKPLLEDINEYGEDEYDEELAEECLEMITESHFIRETIFERGI